MTTAPKSSRVRPRGVTYLAVGVLIIAVLNALRFSQAIIHWQFLSARLPVPTAYIALSGLIWAGIWLALDWGLWRGKKWSARGTGIAAVLYSGYYWFDRLFIAAGAGGANWPFAVTVNIFTLIFIGWILGRKNSRTYFGELHD